VALAVVDEAHIHLPWFHFISVLTFAADTPASDASLLHCLSGHPRYRNAYVGSAEHPEGLHGPYLTGRLPADPYDRATPAAAHRVLLNWIYQFTYGETEHQDDFDLDKLNSWIRSVAGTTPGSALVLADDPVKTIDPKLPDLLERHVVTRLTAARAVYQLRDLPGALAADEWVFNADGFHEFAAIDSTGTSITLVVATDD
jgi:hypothetical protein